MLASKPILETLSQKSSKKIPFWLMRQAGRYLPEYLALRATEKSFLDLVFHPQKASEITIQPLRRFSMDAAILFSDILVVPFAMGQKVSFESGDGPKLDPIREEKDFLVFSSPKDFEKKCMAIYEAVSCSREKLRAEGFDTTTLIGFCGGPWTVSCYMVEGSGGSDFQSARKWSLYDPSSFQKLINLVAESSLLYLKGQAKAGAEVIQIFESWAGLLDKESFLEWVVRPTRWIVQEFKKEYPNVPIIGFPRGAGTNTLLYAKESGIDAIGIDQTIDPFWAAAHLQPIMPVQGNLDPVRLLVGGKALETGMQTIHEAFFSHPFIFNLGHGVIRETPIKHVEKLAQIVQDWNSF